MSVAVTMLEGKRETPAQANSPLHLDSERWQQLQALAADLVTVDLLNFFDANPHTYMTLPDIAARIGRRESQVLPYLGRLVEAGILDAVPVLDLVVYQLNPSGQVRRLVNHFVIWFGESFFWGRQILNPPPGL